MKPSARTGRIRRLAGITSATLALGLGLAPALTVQADATSFQLSLPTTTISLGLPTITLTTDILTTVTLLTTTLPSTSLSTVLPSSTTTAPLSTTAPTISATTRPSPGTPSSTAPGTTTTLAGVIVTGSGGKPSPSTTGSDLRRGFVSTPSTIVSTGDFVDLVVSAPTWERVRAALLPLFSPRILDVVLSPLLVFEIVLGAILRSGQLILLPLAVLGSLIGMGLVRWLPRFREIYQRQVPLSFLRDRGNS